MAVSKWNNDKFREELTQQIKDVGQELIDKAERLVPEDLKFVRGMHISVSLCIDGQFSTPEISYTVEVLPKTFAERIIKGDFEKV